MTVKSEPAEISRDEQGPRGTVLGSSRRRGLPDQAALVVVLAALVAFFSIQSEYFLNFDNFVNILTAAAVVGILAAPGTLLIVAGQIDLSVGSGVAFVGIVLATTAPMFGLPTAILIAICCGLMIGALNGVLVTGLGINSLITTLGMLAILRGFAQVTSNGQTKTISDFDSLGTARPFLDIPVPVLILAAVLLLTGLIARFTVFGRRIYAIGSNPTAARLSGIPSARVIFGTFLLSGAAIALGGLIVTSQLGAASPQAATGLELSVVAAVILGGASLNGGRGTILGTFLGVMILAVLNNGLVLMNIPSFWQDVARGTVLLLAVAVDRLRVRFEERS